MKKKEGRRWVREHLDFSTEQGVIDEVIYTPSHWLYAGGHIL